MARRVRLPSAEDLFRATDEPPTPPAPPEPPAPDASEPERAGGASGRVRHEEKMTIYVTSAELLAIEQARLTLRARHGLSVDRGRLVREAVHLALDGLDADPADSPLVRRLVAEG